MALRDVEKSRWELINVAIVRIQTVIMYSKCRVNGRWATGKRWCTWASRWAVIETWRVTISKTYKRNDGEKRTANGALWRQLDPGRSGRVASLRRTVWHPPLNYRLWWNGAWHRIAANNTQLYLSNDSRSPWMKILTSLYDVRGKTNQQSVVE